jgi:hypothetical protein
MLGNESNMLTTPAGEFVNFIPSIAAAVTPSDSTRFQAGLLYVGTGGDVVCIPANQSTTVTFKNVPSGSFLPVYVIAVYAATGASDMLICY